METSKVIKCYQPNCCYRDFKTDSCCHPNGSKCKNKADA